MTDRNAATRARNRRPTDRARPRDAASGRARGRPVPVEPDGPRSGSGRYVERYLVPFVLPIVVVGGLVMFVLNISRIFLSSHGNVDVLIGTAILLADPRRCDRCSSASPRMRTSSLALDHRRRSSSRSLIGRLALARHRRAGRARRRDALARRGSGERRRSTFQSRDALRVRSRRGGTPRPASRDHARRTTAASTRSTSKTPNTLFETLAGRRRRRHDRWPRVLRRRGRVRLLLHDPRSPRGGHGGRDHRRRRPVTLEEAEAAAEAAGGEGARRRLEGDRPRHLTAPTPAAAEDDARRASPGTRTVSASRTASIVAGSGPTRSPSAYTSIGTCRSSDASSMCSPRNV